MARRGGVVGPSSLGALAVRDRIVLLDHPWPDDDVERSLCEAAGYELIDTNGRSDAQKREAATGALGVLTNWCRVDKSMIDSAPRLRVVTRLGIGIDNIDVRACQARGIAVTRVPDYCVEEVSDHVVGVIHLWARSLCAFNKEAHRGVFNPGARALRRINELVVGFWGAGATGRSAATKMSALGARVYLDDRHPERAAPFSAVPVDELLATCDVVSLHLPLSEQTATVVDRSVLSTMRPGSLLINTARGRLVKVDDLVEALDQGRPGAVALDVFPNEPEIPEILRGRDDVILTPHIAFSSTTAVADVRRLATEDLLAVLAGREPRNPWPPRR